MKAFTTLTASLVALASASSDLDEVCAVSKANHGCSAFCGFEPIFDGKSWFCYPGHKQYPFPTQLEQDRLDICTLVNANSGCSDTCGYKFDAEKGECSLTYDPAKAKPALRRSKADPIIGGYGDFKYQVKASYMLTCLKQ